MSIIQGTSKAAGGAGYEIGQSIRFNDNDSAYLNRTFGSAGNRKTYTFSGWFKRGNILGANTTLALAVQAGGLNSDIHIQSDEKLRFRDQGNSLNLITNQVFRDPGAWFHLVASVDTTQSTASNRAKLYLNGSQITSFSTETYMAQNSEGLINSADNVEIGRNPNGSVFWDGYMAELNFIDGTAKAATDFGEYNDDGVWIPKAYSGAYGTNGFYITGATASDLGEDFSGNGNDFTSAGLTTADQMPDTPSDNFPTLNSIFDYYTSGNTSYFRPNFAVSLLSEGNLKIDFNSPNTPLVYSTATFPSSGKFYFEVTADTANGGGMGIGGSNTIEDGIGSSATTGMSNCIIYNSDGNLFNQSSTPSSYGNASSIANGEFVGVAVDIDNDAIWFCDNGTWVDGNGTDSSATVLAEIEAGTTTSAAATNFLADQNSWHPMVAAVGDYPTYTTNFGQSSFTGAAPAGFTNLTTANLPTPSITDGSAHFQPVLYTGTTGAQDITFSGNSDLAPDWLWFKRRDAASDHFVFDKVRGATKVLKVNSNAQEATLSASMTAFGTDGFTLGDGGAGNDINGIAGATYVAWGWSAGNSAGSSNGDGSISSTVSVNQTSGFSIAKYVGNATSGATVGHGLGAVPQVVICKPMDATENFVMQHVSLGPTKAIYMNITATPYTGTYQWNDTAPTSSVFSLGNHTLNNGSGNTIIAYCFAEIPGYSSFGSYTGNSSTDGTFVYTGFKPSFILTKRTDSTSDWTIEDTTRSTFNLVENALFPNLTIAEDTTGDRMDILSNGFKLRTTAQPNVGTLIYMAFAEHPFANPDGAPATAR